VDHHHRLGRRGALGGSLYIGLMAQCSVLRPSPATEEAPVRVFGRGELPMSRSSACPCDEAMEFTKRGPGSAPLPPPVKYCVAF